MQDMEMIILVLLLFQFAVAVMSFSAIALIIGFMILKIRFGEITIPQNLPNDCN